MAKLLNVDNNAKTVKGQKRGYLTGVLYLAPSDLSGRNVCPMASPGCIAACLNTAGHGAFNNVQQARINKTRALFEDRDAFLAQLHKEIGALIRKAARDGLTPTVRLNGTSDLPWEAYKLDGKSLFEHFPDVQFYDYTKIPKRAKLWAAGKMPANYHLTFSRSEINDADARACLKAGANVAVVFRPKLPATFGNAPVIDGDADDLRFMPQGMETIAHRGVVVGLKAKGRARKENSGFVVDVD